MPKVYVSILAMFDLDGSKKPLGIIWPDGRKFCIDNVLDIRQAANQTLGGTGMRYTCEICGKVVFIYDEEGRWFMEGKSAQSPNAKYESKLIAD